MPALPDEKGRWRQTSLSAHEGSMIDRAKTLTGELTELMSDPANSVSYRKQLRFKVALLTGLMTMRDELDGDIAELTGQMGQQSVRTALKQEPLEQVALVAAAEEQPPNSPGAVRRSRILKGRWALYREGKGPKPNEKAAGRKPGRPRAPHSANGQSKKSAPATIGQGTNGDFIYKYAASHGDVLNLKEAVAAAGKTPDHKNLSVRGRMTVAVAEMKRKGFLVHESEKGCYRLTPLAHQIRRFELQEQQ